MELAASLLADDTVTALGVVVAILVGLFIFVLIILAMLYGKLWFQAYMSNARVSMLSLIGMSFRQVNARVIVQSQDHGHAGRRRHRSAHRHHHARGSRPTTWPAATCRT